MTYDQYLDLTFVELVIKIEAFAERLNRENQLPIVNAWWVGRMVAEGVACVFSEKAKYPTLEDLLEPKMSEPMTPEAMEAQVLALARAYGAKEIIIDGG